MKAKVFQLQDGSEGWAVECVNENEGSREKAIFFGEQAKDQARDWAKRYWVPPAARAGLKSARRPVSTR